MAYWCGDPTGFQYQTLSIAGQTLSLLPYGNSVQLPTAGLGSPEVTRIATLEATVAALDAYIRALNEAIEVQGAAYPQ